VRLAGELARPSEQAVEAGLPRRLGEERCHGCRIAPAEQPLNR
jgi:hypothetical protein